MKKFQVRNQGWRKDTNREKEIEKNHLTPDKMI